MTRCPASFMTVSLALAALAAGVAQAATDADLRARFECRASLAEPATAGRLMRVALPPTVYDACLSGPGADLRVIGDTGLVWPAMLWTAPTPVPAPQTVPAQTLNRSWIEQPPGYLRLDLDTGQARPPHDRVRIRTAGSDYLRRIEVHGSEDGATWGLLGLGYVVRHPGQYSAANDVVLYPRSTFRHVQLRVFPDARDARTAPVVEDARLELAAPAPAPDLQPVEFDVLPTPREEERPAAQVILLDARACHLPVATLHITAGGGEYARSVSVSVRDHATNAWQWAGGGAIHRIGSSVQEQVAVSSAGRYWRVEIRHDDDPPLAAVRISGKTTRRWLIIDPPAAGNAALYYGSPSIGPATFDLSRRIDDARCAAAATVALAPHESNPLRKPEPRPPAQWIIPVGVGLAAALVLFVIFRMIRAGPPPRER